MAGENGLIKKDLLILTGTNFGPQNDIIANIILKKSFPKIKLLLKKEAYGVIIHNYLNPLSARLPCPISIGEKKDFILKYDKDCFLKADYVRIGFLDTFGRKHWVPRKAHKRVKREYQKMFKNNG